MPKPSYTLEIATDGSRYMNVALARKRHESFCLHYMSTMNGSQAALAAGYSARNPKNAHIIAWTLLKREDIRTRLEELRKEAADDAIMSLIDRQLVLSQIGRACLRDYQDENGRFKPLDENSPNPAAIESVEYKYDSVKRESYPVRIRLRDPIDAIVELCKLDGSYKKQSAGVGVDARQSIVNVSVETEKVRQHVERIIDGHRIEDVPLLGEGKQEGASEKTSR